MQNDYIRAAVPDCVTILGKRLRPFCIGHFNLLSRLSSCYIKGGEPGKPDLLTAITVCSKTREEGYEFFGPGWEEEIARWSNEVTGRTRLRRLMRLQPYTFDWSEKFALFNYYLSEGFLQPRVSFDPESSRESTSPWQERLMIKMWRINPNWTESELLNMPLALMLQRTMTADELDGAVMFEGGEMDEALAWHEELEAEERKHGGL